MSEDDELLDVDDLETASKPKSKKYVEGVFSEAEDQVIKDNWDILTEEQIASKLNRTFNSLHIHLTAKVRSRLGLRPKRIGRPLAPRSKEQIVASLPEDKRRSFFLKELRSTIMYKSIKNVLDNEELNLYEEKYLNFMTDPTIETMTTMEKDAWHEMTMAQIRIFRYLKEEKVSKDTGKTISRSKEIRDCEDIIETAQESLNVQRRQRLKNQNDQAVTFTNVIKELKDPNTRRRTGIEAAMLKYIAEATYNAMLGKNIFSGTSEPYNIEQNFKNGATPSGLSPNFTG